MPAYCPDGAHNCAHICPGARRLETDLLSRVERDCCASRPVRINDTPGAGSAPINPVCWLAFVVCNRENPNAVVENAVVDRVSPAVGRQD